MFGAGNEIRTRDPNLGKVVLYQLSYSREVGSILAIAPMLSSDHWADLRLFFEAANQPFSIITGQAARRYTSIEYSVRMADR